MVPSKSFAAGGIFASGGGSKTVGQTFTVTVSASGADFDSLQGTISVSGPVDIVSFSGGGATWLPGKSPSNGGQFVGIVGATNSLTVATIKLKGTSAGSGTVSVSGVKLARNGAITGTGTGNADFTIEKAPDLPSNVKVSSSSHPDSNASYEATAIVLSWNKEGGVDGFSYLLDQGATTTPTAKITDANTSATYADKAVGTYYFHIRAHKSDGWGGTTHFKINIKEPDAKIDTTLSKPNDIKIEKDSTFLNSIKDGTVSGIVITGKTEPGFTANITLTPAPTIPEGKMLTAIADESGNWKLLIDFSIAAGFHKLTVQGQKLKVLTPVSDEIAFEISQSKGGSINILTDSDINAPAPVKAETTKKGFKLDKKTASYALFLIGLLILVIVCIIVYVRKNNQRKLLSSFKK